MGNGRCPAAGTGGEVGWSLGTTAGEVEGSALGFECLESDDTARRGGDLSSGSQRDFRLPPPAAEGKEGTFRDGPLPPDPLGFFMDL